MIECSQRKCLMETQYLLAQIGKEMSITFIIASFMWFSLCYFSKLLHRNNACILTINQIIARVQSIFILQNVQFLIYDSIARSKGSCVMSLRNIRNMTLMSVLSLTFQRYMGDAISFMSSRYVFPGSKKSSVTISAAELGS